MSPKDFQPTHPISRSQVTGELCTTPLPGDLKDRPLPDFMSPEEFPPIIPVSCHRKIVHKSSQFRVTRKPATDHINLTLPFQFRVTGRSSTNHPNFVSPENLPPNINLTCHSNFVSPKDFPPTLPISRSQQSGVTNPRCLAT